LASALVSFSVADLLAHEAGIAAVATTGIVLGNINIPYEDEVSEFKGDITLLVLSFIFITLAALLEPKTLLNLGYRGLVVVFIIALVIRPLAVYLSTVGDRFTMEERAFISFVGPRGIIPASVATLFAIELSNRGMTDAANALVGTVFLVILMTVVIEGGFARTAARKLDIIPMRVLVIGGGKVGRALADRLEERGEDVIIIEQDSDVIEIGRANGHAVRQGDGTDTEELRQAGAENAKILVAATGDDDVNLLVAQLANSKFNIETILARVENPDNVEAFEELGVRAISSTMATAWALDNAIERPTISTWMTELGRTGDVQEVKLNNEDFIGRTVAEVAPDLPQGCLIALIARDDQKQVPTGSDTLM
ncbi:MAG: TrkA family potassium uptake protein, partial [Halobacteriaceae archaeon]